MAENPFVRLCLVADETADRKKFFKEKHFTGNEQIGHSDYYNIFQRVIYTQPAQIMI